MTRPPTTGPHECKACVWTDTERLLCSRHLAVEADPETQVNVAPLRARLLPVLDNAVERLALTHAEALAVLNLLDRAALTGPGTRREAAESAARVEVAPGAADSATAAQIAATNDAPGTDNETPAGGTESA